MYSFHKNTSLKGFTKRLFLFITVITAFVSCTDEYAGDSKTLDVLQSSFLLKSSEDWCDVEFRYDGDWSIDALVYDTESGETDWITPAVQSGSGNAKIRFTAQPNETFGQRSVQVWIKTQAYYPAINAFQIVQDGKINVVTGGASIVDGKMVFSGQAIYPDKEYIIESGIRYRLADADDYTSVVNEGDDPGTISVSLDSYEKGVEYVYQAYSIDKAGEMMYGKEKVFMDEGRVRQIIYHESFGELPEGVNEDAEIARPEYLKYGQSEAEYTLSGAVIKHDRQAANRFDEKNGFMNDGKLYYDSAYLYPATPPVVLMGKNNTSGSLQINNLKVSHAKNVQLSFVSMRLGANNTKFLPTDIVIEYSIDGATWNNLEYARQDDDWEKGKWLINIVALPDEIENSETLSLKFSFARVQGAKRVDDIVLYGDVIPEN